MRLSRLLALLLALVAGCAPRPEASEAPVRTVEVRGRFVTAYDGRPPRGVYGLPVYLLFRRSDGSGWDRARLPPGPLRRHRQFDVLDETGRFRFAFATSLDLSAYDEIAVVGATETETVSLVPTPRGARRLRTPEGEVTLLPLADAVRQPIPTEGPIRLDEMNAVLRPEIGVPVRYAEIAREFVRARYDGAPPFDLPPVRVELGSGGNLFQAFDPDALGGTEIELNVGRAPTATVVAHEYGHYVSFRMWGAHWWRYTLRNKNLREGWGIFFSFATRAYAARTYGDIDLGPSNPERAPFSHLIRSGRRYDGIAYGTSHPDFAAIGSLLWSLYDGAERAPFEPDAPGLQGDNDDISGHGLDVFEAVRLSRASVLNEAGIREVVVTFKRSVPEALAPSVDGAVDFFLCPSFPDCDFKALPSDDPSTGRLSLRPAAPGNLTARPLAGGAVELRWERRVPAAPWANPPTAYRVYRDGALLATLPSEATSYVTLGEAASGRYEVRAVGGDGESYGTPSVRLGPAAGD